MKTKVHFSLLVFLFFYFACAVTVFSQSTSKGTLKGRIIGSDTKKALPYATVMIVGTNNGAAADAEGNYIIRNVEAGKQEVSASYIGYETRKLEVKIQPDKITELNIKLEITAIKGKEVVVSAQRVGQQEAINEQINSKTIVNVVSPDRLQENPDANAAEALGRLPGLSLIRSGGEGTSIVIRGMMPQYSTVTLNGVELPSTDDANRSTSVSGISQFLLQQVEVYKAITPDMDGNSVAGSINLTLAPARDSLHFNLLAQNGYNHQNNYLGNYRFVGDISDRLFDKKLGVRLDLDVEKVNRSTETMGASYNVISNTGGGLVNEPVLLQSVGLNDISNIPDKQAATLVLDYSFSPSTKVFIYSLFSRSYAQVLQVNKTLGSQTSRYYTTNINQNNNTSLLSSSSIRVEHSLQWANIDYGAAFSQTHNYSPENKSWTWLPYGLSLGSITNAQRLLTPQQFASTMSLDNIADSTLSKEVLYAMGFSSDDMIQKNITPYLNVKIPFSFGNNISGYIKGGAKYNYISRDRNYLDGNQNPTSLGQLFAQTTSEFNWITLNASNVVNALGFFDHPITNFLNNQYNFGWYPNVSRLNQLWDWWNNFSNNALAQGKDSVIKKYSSVANIGFVPDVLGSSLNDQTIDEKYIGTYLMSEINFGNLIMFLPGARYEKVTDNLTGHSVLATVSTYGLSIPGKLVNAVHNDEFLLPMVHLQITPNNWMRIHMSYTQALGRPDFVALMPNTFVNNLFGSYTYITGNPYLKPELWTNYDFQLAIFSNKIGLFSINGFYKKVKDKIWQRNFSRLPGDPLIPGFPDNTVVSVSEWENHKDDGYVKGAEFEWQTNFWYLPSPFNYFSLNFNYTILNSQQQYPTTRLWTTYTYDSRGRPTAKLNRVDSAITDQMLNQPDNIANISLGFNYKGLNAWLSYQYNGKTLTGWTTEKEIIPYQNNFSRWDLQISQKLPVEGMEVLFNVANISNFQQVSTMNGDPRPTYIESYGWTSDLGLRYNF